MGARGAAHPHTRQTPWPTAIPPPSANSAEDGRAHLDQRVQSNGGFAKVPAAMHVSPWSYMRLRVDWSKCEHSGRPRSRKLQERDWTLEAHVTFLLGRPLPVWRQPYNIVRMLRLNLSPTNDCVSRTSSVWPSSVCLRGTIGGEFLMRTGRLGNRNSRQKIQVSFLTRLPPPCPPALLPKAAGILTLSTV